MFSRKKIQLTQKCVIVFVTHFRSYQLHRLGLTKGDTKYFKVSISGTRAIFVLLVSLRRSHLYLDIDIYITFYKEGWVINVKDFRYMVELLFRVILIFSFQPIHSKLVCQSQDAPHETVCLFCSGTLVLQNRRYQDSNLFGRGGEQAISGQKIGGHYGQFK